MTSRNRELEVLHELHQNHEHFHAGQRLSWTDSSSLSKCSELFNQVSSELPFFIDPSMWVECEWIFKVLFIIVYRVGIDQDHCLLGDDIVTQGSGIFSGMKYERDIGIHSESFLDCGLDKGKILKVR